MKDWFQQLTSFSKIVGVEIQLLANQEYCIHVVILEKNKNTIQLVEKHNNISSFSTLKEKIKKDIPLCISLSGKGVLHKFLPKNIPTDNPIELIGQALPNAKAEDFFYQILENEKVISIIRKNVFEGLHQKLLELNLSILQVSLGGLVIHQLQNIGLLTNIPEAFGKHKITYVDKKLNSYQFISSAHIAKYTFGEEKISTELITAYATAFQYFIPLDPIQADIEYITEEKEELIEKKKFTLIGWSLLLTFLVILVVNFIVFSTYNKENQQFQGRVNVYKHLLVKQDSLQKRFDEKNYFLKKTGWLTPCKTSYYADQLGNSVPKQIRLTQLDIYPKDEKKSQKERKLLFEYGHLIMSGECSKVTRLNPWINKIKKMEWVKEVKEVNYDYDTKKRKGFFTIRIALK